MLRFVYGYGIGFSLIIAGLLFILKHYPVFIRGTHLNFGWLLIVLGIVRIIWAFYAQKKGRDEQN